VIGQGFVGGALTTVMARTFTVFAYDKAGRYAKGASPPLHVKGAPRDATSVAELVRACEAQEGFTGVYFVCLPTPMRADGSCDTSIVEGVLGELAGAPYNPMSPHCLREEPNRTERVAVIKSTVPPGTVSRWNAAFGSRLRVVFQPEFLTEANALRDFEEQTRIVIGGEHPWSDQVANVFRAAFPRTPIIKTSSTNAEAVKYLTNCFLATKVAFANEMKQVCDAVGADYDRVIEVALHDGRLGETHWAVPGPDGHYGFGGSCFSKDINAMMYTAKMYGVDPKVMNGAWEKNLEVRPERDWEQLKGRAVSS
jgi:UDPglucose 6-dehydrogenase